jgi:hypothetical protein
MLGNYQVAAQLVASQLNRVSLWNLHFFINAIIVAIFLCCNCWRGRKHTWAFLACIHWFWKYFSFLVSSVGTFLDHLQENTYGRPVRTATGHSWTLRPASRCHGNSLLGSTKHPVASFFCEIPRFMNVGSELCDILKTPGTEYPIA